MFIVKVTILRLLLILLALISASPAQAFWVNKREVCAQAAIAPYDATGNNLRTFWHRLGIQRSFDNTPDFARVNIIRNYCAYYK